METRRSSHSECQARESKTATSPCASSPFCAPLLAHCIIAYYLGRLAAAWRETPTTWYPLPVGVGALLLALITWRKKVQRESDDTEASHVQPRSRWKVCTSSFLVVSALPSHQCLGQRSWRSASAKHVSRMGIFEFFGASNMVPSLWLQVLRVDVRVQSRRNRAV